MKICMGGVNAVQSNSFIYDKILAILYFNKIRKKRYISIMGDPLNIKYKINCRAMSPKRNTFCEGDFLV